jgi:RsiW-degrading membrane proteinase PrsW (M82 family)
MVFLPALVPGAIVGSALAPALLLLWLVVTADSRPEPPRVVWICVGLGALIAIPVGLLEFALRRHLPIVPNPWIGGYEAALVLAGLPEEIVKIAIIAVVAWRSRDFDEPMDGVVYGTAVGLGFAAVENLGYVAGNAHWFGVAVLRGLLSVPFHAALGAIAGAYIASARFGGALGAHRSGRWRRQRLWLLAWLIPIALHTLFDGPVGLQTVAGDPGDTSDPVAIVAMTLLMPVVGFGSIVYAVRLARSIARHQKKFLHSSRLPPAHWRAVWAESLLGVGLSSVAGSLVFSASGAAQVAGWILMAAGIVVCWKCARYLNGAAKRRHPAVATPAA